MSISTEQIFNASANGVIVTDSKGIVLKANRNALTVYGIDAQGFIGAPVFDVLPMTGEVIRRSLGNMENIRGTLVRENDVSVVLDVTLFSRVDLFKAWLPVSRKQLSLRKLQRSLSSTNCRIVS